MARVGGERSIELARIRKAIRLVVKEGELRAWRVMVSIP